VALPLALAFGIQAFGVIDSKDIPEIGAYVCIGRAYRSHDVRFFCFLVWRHSLTD
jgi:hypothetical protein